MMANLNDSAWMGEVPIDWRMTSVKRVAYISPSFSNGKPRADEVCTVVPMEAVSKFGRVNTEFQELFSDLI